MRFHVFAMLAVLGALAGPAWTQTPPPAAPTTGASRAPRIEAHQLLYDATTDRVIVRGEAKFFYDAYILSADQLIYDRKNNKFVAEGNSRLDDPNGSITRAERFEALDDFRDAFVDAICRRGIAQACGR